MSESIGPAAADPSSADRSADACPVCGEHRLAIIDFPELPGGVPSPAAELVGGRGADPSAPSIGCLACGAEWPDVAAFRSAVATAESLASSDLAVEPARGDAAGAAGKGAPEV